MSSWQQLLQQEAGVLISTPKRAKRVRRKRVRTSPLSGTARRMLVSHCSLAGPDDSLNKPDSGDVRTRFLRTRLARLGVEIKTPASCCSSCCQDDIFSRLLRVNPLNTKLSCWNFNLVNADQFSRE